MVGRNAGSLAVFLAFVLGAIALPARAQEVEATVDQSQVALGDPVTLSIRVSGGSARTPDVPHLRDARVNFIGREESFSLVNTNFARTISFNFLVTPLREGTLTIPPIPVPVDGNVLQTRPIQILVGRSAGSSEAGDTGGAEEAEDVFVEAELEPHEAYVGQQVLQKVRIYVGVQQGDQAQVGRRPIPGTIDEQLPDAIQRRFTASVKGRNYRVEEIVWPFYPVSAGTIQVPSVDVTVPVVVEQRRRGRRGMDPFFDDFFGMRQLVPKSFRTEETGLEVLPLPAAGRPAGFSGLVGRFTVKAELSQDRVGLGDSVTQTVTVLGQGNLRDLALPALGSADFRTYDDSPAVEVLQRDGTVYSRKVFKRALVAQKSGSLTVPPLTISYFDPAIKRYQTISTEAFRINVSPGPGGETVAAAAGVNASRAGKQAVKVTGEDILPTHTGPQVLADRDVELRSPGTMALLVGPPLVFGIAATLRRRRERASADPILRRRRQALRVATAGLAELERDRGTDARAQLDRLSRLFRGYLGDKLNREGAALTSGEARERLEAVGVGPALAAEAGKLIEQLEQARYAPGGGSASLEALKAGARSLVQRLEKELG